MDEREVWVLFGLYTIENHYECEDIISIHAKSHSAHEQKAFLEKYSEQYDSYKVNHFAVLKETK